MDKKKNSSGKTFTSNTRYQPGNYVLLVKMAKKEGRTYNSMLNQCILREAERQNVTHE